MIDKTSHLYIYKYQIKLKNSNNIYNIYFKKIIFLNKYIIGSVHYNISSFKFQDLPNNKKNTWNLFAK